MPEIDRLPSQARRGRVRVVGSVLGTLLALVTAVLAGFGWLDLLHGLGIFGFGPRLHDALPLRRLAGASDQPLGRVLVAFASVGLVAGLALTRVRRPVRFGLLLVGSVVLVALASGGAYAVEETQNLGATLSTRHPGLGALVEAIALAGAGALPPTRVRRLA